ncbi:MAG: helix-turn-helix domain-containing protein [Anaerolineae bacterium]
MSQSSLDHELLTADEVAEYLRVSQFTVWRWCKTGLLPAFQIGREWRIRKTGLTELIEALESGVTLGEDNA